MSIWFRFPRNLVICTTVLCSLGRGQNAPAGGDSVIRAETRVVLVDAVPVDKKNNFPRDLTQKDFRIWEDGKEQKITSFSLESAAVSPERSGNHYIVLFFDTAGSSQLRERQQTTQFVDGFASPDRYMAVMDSYGQEMRVIQNFTADPGRIKQALNELQSGSRAIQSAAGGGRGRGAGAGNAGEDFTAYRSLLRSLISTADSVASIRGRKALVLYSAGFDTSPELNNDIAAAIEACNKANVAIYTVLLGATFGGSNLVSAESDAAPAAGGRGGRGGGGGAGADATQADPAMNALRSISDGTGGFSVLTTNDLTAVLGKIAQEQDSYYLLGYTPAVESAEGTCHTLKVKTDRSGITVRARESYCTSRPTGLLSASPAGKDLEARAASVTAANVTAKMQLSWFYSAPNLAQVDLAMDIAPSSVKLQKVKGKLHGEIELTGVANKPDGSAAGRFSDTVKLDFQTQQEADAFLKSPYHYVNQFQIAPGQYTFRLVFSPGDQEIGKIDTPLNIQPWDGHVFSMSAITLSRDAHTFNGLAAGLDDEILEGPRPLISKGTEIVPTGTNQFRAGDHSYLYFEVYEPKLASVPVPAAGPTAANLPSVGVRVRVLDGVTGEAKSDTGLMNAASFMRPGNPVMAMAMATQTADLPAGSYKIEVTAVRDSGDTVVRTADFDVIR